MIDPTMLSPDQSKLSSPGDSDTKQAPRLLDQIGAAIRTKHYSRRTEEAYTYWARKFILFHKKRHPLEMGEAEVGQFLQHLAVNRSVSASTQNQALNALLFLYQSVLHRPLGKLPPVYSGKAPRASSRGNDLPGGVHPLRRNAGTIASDGATPLWNRFTRDRVRQPPRERH